MQLSSAQMKAMWHEHVPLHSCFCCMFMAVFTLGAGWKTLSCCAGGSDAYKGITTMGPQLSGRCLAMSRHVLARASISSWPVMKTKMSWDGGASCAKKQEHVLLPVLRRMLTVHEQAHGKDDYSEVFVSYITERKGEDSFSLNWKHS